MTDLFICIAIAGHERRDVYGVAQGLITGRVDNITQRLFCVLDTATFRVPVPEVPVL